MDIAISGLALIVLAPLLVAIACAVRVESRGPALFRQRRVGRHGRLFTLLKFRSMFATPSPSGPLVTVRGDPRVTRFGRLLRRTKLDELPQLWNVLRGDMSLVGPRPEVPHYVALYNAAQRRVLDWRPGITDPASLAFMDEERVLASHADPERAYREEVMPQKLRINLEYAERATPISDLRILAATARRVTRGRVALPFSAPSMGEGAVHSWVTGGLILAAATLVHRAAAVGAVLIVGRRLGPEALGVLGWVQSTAAMSGLFLGAAGGLVLARRIAHPALARHQAASCVAATLMTTGCASALGALLFVAAPWLSESAFGDGSASAPLRWAWLLIVGSALQLTLSGALLGMRAHRAQVVAAVAAAAVTLLTTPPLADRFGIAGAVCGLATGAWAYSLVCLHGICKRLRLAPGWLAIRREARYLLRKLAPATLISSVSAPADFVCLTALCSAHGPGELGIYVAANQAFLLCRTLSAGLATASVSAGGADQPNQSWTGVLQVALVAPVMLVGALGAPLWISPLGESFTGAAPVLRLLMLTALAYAVSQAAEKRALAEDRDWAATTAAGGWIVCCLLIFLVLTRRDAMGLAAARAAAYGAQCAMIWGLTRYRGARGDCPKLNNGHSTERRAA